jgi:hypothetical protein
MEADMDRIFHGKRETAATLGISVRTLENLVAMREITPRHIGRRVLFEAREIERFARRDHRTKQERKDSIVIDDARVLRNKQGQLWLAMPSYSVPVNGGRSYDYLPAVILSTKLKRDVEDTVLPAFEAWEREQSAPVQGGAR